MPVYEFNGVKPEIGQSYIDQTALSEEMCISARTAGSDQALCYVVMLAR
jgi:hypothetical protein